MKSGCEWQTRRTFVETRQDVFGIVKVIAERANCTLTEKQIVAFQFPILRNEANVGKHARVSTVLFVPDAARLD